MAAIELYSMDLFNDANLQAYYRFTSGAITTDSKGSNTLTNNGTVTTGTGVFDDAADLGASNSTKSLTRAANLGLTGTVDLSISFWVKLQTEIGSGQYVFFGHDTTLTTARYFFLFYQYNSGTRRLLVDTSGTAFSYNITLGTTNWTHIAVVRDISGTGQTHLYVNGTDVAQGGIGTSTATGNNFNIGVSVPATADWSSSLFDDWAVFNRTLTASEVDEIANGVGSASASPSVTPSASPSLSPSASQSPSASESPSPSVSVSASPSLSPSLSTSPSLSPSLSPSSSKSPSPSVSVSASPSLSPSASPSLGYSQYTRGDLVALPGNDNDLETTYIAQDETDVSTKNDVRVDQTATSQYMIHQYKDFVGANTTCQVEWEGQVTLAPSSSTVYLQIYNQNTTTWETIDSDNS